jgi:hypothetical protein
MTGRSPDQSGQLGQLSYLNAHYYNRSQETTTAGFYLRMETKSSLRNVVFKNRQWIMSKKINALIYHRHELYRAFKYSNSTDGLMRTVQNLILVYPLTTLNSVHKLIEVSERIMFCNITTLPILKHLTARPLDTRIMATRAINAELRRDEVWERTTRFINIIEIPSQKK